MSEDTYDFECMRAELLGLEKPDKEKFELEESEKLKLLHEQNLAEQANEVETQDETLQSTSGKLDELNSILSSTQQKLLRFKSNARNSLSNIFRSQSKDETATVSMQDIEKDKNLMENITKENEGSSLIVNKNETSLNIQKKMTSHLDKLDSLINKAENAELSMESQNKKMKKFLK